MRQETSPATERLSTVDPPPQAAVEPAATPALSNAAMTRYLAGFPPGTAPPSVPGQTAQPASNAAMASVQARRHGRTRAAPRGRPRHDVDISFNPVIWTWQVRPRKRPVYKKQPERGLEQEALTLYKDDTVTLGVGFLGLNAAPQGAYEPMLFTLGDAEVDGLTPRFTGNTFVWTLRFRTMGHTTLAASFDGSGLHNEWTKKVTVYGDLTDFKQMLERTSDLINADILEAGAKVNNASAAYKAAYEKQKGVLDKEAKRRQMLEDMLWDALFAGLGGLTGGVVGFGMGKWMGETLKKTLQGGTAIDMVKDVTKSLTKSAAKMGKPAGSIQDLELKPISVTHSTSS